MLGAAVMTVALSFATSGKALYDRSTEDVGGHGQLPKEEGFALAQSQRGFASVTKNPRHLYGEDRKSAAGVK